MKKWVLARLNEHTTWVAIVGNIGAIAVLPVIDARTVITMLVSTVMGILMGKPDKDKND